jgi:membrane protein YqaA with SNARE-associated domain
VRRLFFQLLSYFLTPAGIVSMGILDASMVFFLPLGIDFVVIIMAARTPRLSWLYVILATVGSTIGSAGTFWIGRKAGDGGLAHFVSPQRLERVKVRVERGAVVVALLALIPPPFPFTPFVLVAGAIGMRPWAFLLALSAVRTIRFGAEAALAAHYGSHILHWMRAPLFTDIVGAFSALAVIGTIVSVISLAGGPRRKSRPLRRAAWRS